MNIKQKFVLASCCPPQLEALDTSAPERGGVTPIWESEARTSCAFPPNLVSSCSFLIASSACCWSGQFRPGQATQQARSDQIRSANSFERSRTRSPQAVSHPATFRCTGQIRPEIDSYHSSRMVSEGWVHFLCLAVRHVNKKQRGGPCHRHPHPPRLPADYRAMANRCSFLELSPQTKF